VKYPKQVWPQLKAKTRVELIAALERDGWVRDESKGAVLVYLHESDHRRVTIHYHPSKGYGAGQLKDVLDDIGWSERDMRRLKLIK
jgi:predicted RNA binding protein YcfA (HicA-like mRNA interferase family)